MTHDLYTEKQRWMGGGNILSPFIDFLPLDPSYTTKKNKVKYSSPLGVPLSYVPIRYYGQSPSYRNVKNAKLSRPGRPPAPVVTTPAPVAAARPSPAPVAAARPSPAPVAAARPSPAALSAHRSSAARRRSAARSRSPTHRGPGRPRGRSRRRPRRRSAARSRSPAPVAAVAAPVAAVAPPLLADLFSSRHTKSEWKAINRKKLAKESRKREEERRLYKIATKLKREREKAERYANRTKVDIARDNSRDVKKRLTIEENKLQSAREDLSSSVDNSVIIKKIEDSVKLLKKEQNEKIIVENFELIKEKKLKKYPTAYDDESDWSEFESDKDEDKDKGRAMPSLKFIRERRKEILEDKILTAETESKSESVATPAIIPDSALEKKIKQMKANKKKIKKKITKKLTDVEEQKLSMADVIDYRMEKHRRIVGKESDSDESDSSDVEGGRSNRKHRYKRKSPKKKSPIKKRLTGGKHIRKKSPVKKRLTRGKSSRKKPLRKKPARRKKSPVKKRLTGGKSSRKKPLRKKPARRKKSPVKRRVRN